jgi:hypothetical protein
MDIKLTPHGFKDNDSALRSLEMRPIMLFLLTDLINWADDRSLPVVLTSTVRGRLPESTSDTHGEGRAFDVSVRGWAEDQILECAKYFNDQYAKDYGTGPMGKPPLVVVYHKTETGAYHFHFQVRRA